MTTRFARAISWIFHPSLLTTYFLLLFFQITPVISSSISEKGKWIVLSMVFLFTFLLPGLTALLLWKIKTIRSLDMEHHEERKLPFLAGTIYYMTCYYLMRELQLPVVLSLLMLGATIVVFTISIISLYWKVSIHLAGIGGICGAILGLRDYMNYDLTWLMISCFLISGYIGMARLKLGSHTPAQIYLGFVLGFVIQFLLIYYH